MNEKKYPPIPKQPEPQTVEYYDGSGFTPGLPIAIAIVFFIVVFLLS